MKWYYYLHSNGEILGKNPVVADGSYFDSPFVKMVWKVETTDRESLVKMLIEARMMGANPERIKELEEKNGVTQKDYECMRRIINGEDRAKVVAEIFGY